MAACERCGTESPSEFRFCPGCGAALTLVGTRRQTRKVVTALFCDVTGSTALGERLDPEVLRGVLNRYFSEMREIIERHGGTVEKFIGDAVMAVFGIPRVHEDDALRAVRAAAEIRARMPAVAQEVGLPLRFRTGVNTGPVLTGDGDSLASGDALNVAARLEQAAAPGEIVIGAQTFELVRDAVQVDRLEPLTLKGKSEPVIAFRLVSVDPVAEGVARHLDRPLVGRERELRRLIDAWERTVSERGCQLVSLLGMAGVGKSRLAAELLERAGPRALVLHGRCLPYGDGITFWPLIEALKPAGEPARAVLEHLEHGGIAAAAELFLGVRRLLEALAAGRPAILHMDDLQWAQPMLLDLLDHVADLSRGAPILLLCTARPELLEERPRWGGGKFNATTFLLEPLEPAASERLLEHLGDDLDAETRTRVIAASAGNPLFLEEMAALAREQGAVTVPSTIQTLLAARLERLAADERELLERGAIEGEVFHRLSLCALSGQTPPPEVDPQLLMGLVRKELIRPHAATFPGDEAFCFRHLLIRDAAYDALTKAARTQLHERFAGWLEQSGAGLPELEEIVGWHLEQAVRYRRELGGEAEPGLSRRAARHLLVAAHRARERMDSTGARQLLERALTLAPPGEAIAGEIAVDLAEQLLDVYDLERADQLLSAAEHDSTVTGAAALVRLQWLLHARPDEAIAAIDSQLPAMLEQLTRAGDDRGLAKAHMAGQWVHWLAGRATAAGEQAGLAAAHARAAGDEGLHARAVSYQLEGLALGRAHATEIAYALDALERAERSPYVAATLKRARAVVYRLQGRFADARGLIALAEEDLAALGMPTASAYDYMRLAELELSAGQPAAAREALQRGDAPLAKQGERAYRATVQALLAEVHECLDDQDAASAAIELAERLSLPDDVMNFALTHGVRARLALAQGDAPGAERWGRSAVALTLKTDFVLDQARARVNLARVLAALGRSREATCEAHAALELYELKGDEPGARRARALAGGDDGT